MSYDDYDSLAAVHLIGTTGLDKDKQKDLVNGSPVDTIYRDKEKINAFGNSRLRKELGRLGVGTVITFGQEDAYRNSENGTIFAYHTYGDDKMEIGSRQEYQLGSGGIEVARTKVLLPASLEARIPVFNGPSLRALDDKWEQYKLAPDFLPKTIKFDYGQAIDKSSIDLLQGSRLVVKPNKSAGGSKGIRFCDRSEVFNNIAGVRDDLLNENAKDKAILVQEFIPGLSWAELRGVDAENDQTLASAKDTELRIYCYVDRARTIPNIQRYYATARIWSVDGEDHWASIDQDSVPSQAWHIADVVSDRLLAKANVPGGYFAIDLFQGDAGDGLDERIFMREVNINNPVMVAEKYNKQDYIMQSQLLANVMSKLAKQK